MSDVIYADAAATTPVKQEVLDAVIPALTAEYGNPSSTHQLGHSADAMLTAARASVASVAGVRSGDVVFTSGGTESNNLALKGIALAQPRGRHIVHSSIEHPSVVETCGYLARHHGFTVDIATVDGEGILDLDAFASLLREDTTLVSVMAVNNEIGTIQPIDEVSDLAQSVGARVHCDGVQAAGWLNLKPLAAQVDALSVSGHKIGGLKGSGVLLVRGRLPLEAVIHGGGQERGRRSGTQNVAGAVSTAVALRIAQQQLEAPQPNNPGAVLAERVLAGVNTRGRERVRLTGHPDRRVPGIVSFVVPEAGGETVLLELERLGVLGSSGSACAAGRTDPSDVLLALGVPLEEAASAVRLSFSRGVSQQVIEKVAEAMIASVQTIIGD